MGTGDDVGEWVLGLLDRPVDELDRRRDDARAPRDEIERLRAARLAPAERQRRVGRVSAELLRRLGEHLRGAACESALWAAVCRRWRTLS